MIHLIKKNIVVGLVIFFAPTYGMRAQKDLSKRFDACFQEEQQNELCEQRKEKLKIEASLHFNFLNSEHDDDQSVFNLMTEHLYGIISKEDGNKDEDYLKFVDTEILQDIQNKLSLQRAQRETIQKYFNTTCSSLNYSKICDLYADLRDIQDEKIEESSSEFVNKILMDLFLSANQKAQINGKPGAYILEASLGQFIRFAYKRQEQLGYEIDCHEAYEKLRNMR